MPDDHYSTKGPICPYCGHQHNADEAFYYDENMARMECEACERDFDVRVYVRTSWTTSKRDAALARKTPL